MELNSPPIDVILSHSGDQLGRLQLDWNPQPGAYIEVEGQIYLVLERRHRYLLRSNQYQLHQVALYVQKSHAPIERSLIDGQWVIGDTTCLYNAHSEVLRCAVNPSGPCDRCPHYQPLKQEPLHS